MRTSTLLARNLTWYWRTNLAVVVGVAAGAAVLGGALLVGGSVRASLRGLALSRLGNTEYVVSRDGFFGEPPGGGCPLIWLEGLVTHEASGRRAGRVEVYGVDERFTRFHGDPGPPPSGRQAQLTAALAQELGGTEGDTILLRLPKPSAIPLDSLHGRKEDVGKTIRMSMGGVAAREFSLRLQQGALRAVYVPLGRLQRELDQPGRVNTMLARHLPDPRRFSLADLGVQLRHLEPQASLSLETGSAILNDALAEAALHTARSLGLRAQPVLTYLANTIRAGAREIPYSLVTALDSPPAPASEDAVTLNQWAARELGARTGDPLVLEYYVWKPDGRLQTESARFRVAGIAPIAGAAADRQFAPPYPGISESLSLAGWDPPFPLNLKRIREVDERYWRQYRTTPKAFIHLARGRRLWATRYGSLTSLRISPPSPQFAPALRGALDPLDMGLSIRPARAQALEAAGGATDFGEYFLYFSFFLVASALLLTGLFFKLGVEQRMREAGLLRALGFSMSQLRRLFLLEGLVLAIAGALVGTASALGYCAAVMLGLRTWWVDAVGTRLLSLHASATPLALGAAAGVAAGLAAIAWTLRRMEPVTPRGLLAGGQSARPSRRLWWAGGVSAVLACLLVSAALLDRIAHSTGFFTAGFLLLAAALLCQWAWLRSQAPGAIRGLLTLGARNAACRPGRSILCIALIASATFLIVSLDAFRRDASAPATGGYPLLAESALPIVHDPNAPEGREALNLPALEGVKFVPFRLRPGDDASCLNLYRPRAPRILAPQSVWPQLESPQPGGAVAAIADANSLRYVLHRKVGDEVTYDGVRYRIVAALRDSLFQGELLISESNFLRLFPGSAGYRFFLIAAPPSKAAEITAAVETALADYGFDVQATASRLAGFHKVENAYLSTFRALGSLGLVLGTIGLGAVLLRNVLERRKELALLRAVGYRPRHLAAMVLAENLVLLAAGLATGAGCALPAILPSALARGGQLPLLAICALLGVVFAAGIAASLAATAAALRSPLLAALRSE